MPARRFFQVGKPEAAPDVLLFDLGNILVRLNSADLFWPGQNAAPGTLPFEERWGRSQAVRAYETGRISRLEDFYQEARREMGFTVAWDDFQPLFRQIIGGLFRETVPLLQTLRQTYVLMLLSNTNQEHWIHCRDNLGLGQYFQAEFLSCQMGVMKPDPLIFQQVLTAIGHNPQNIWYFDDRLENVETARKFGIRSFASFGGPIIIRHFRQLGLLQ
jgi:glucose-1-phosphatase